MYLLIMKSTTGGHMRGSLTNVKEFATKEELQEHIVRNPLNSGTKVYEATELSVRVEMSMTPKSEDFNIDHTLHSPLTRR